MKFHEDPFLQRLTLVCGHVIMNTFDMFVFFVNEEFCFGESFTKRKRKRTMPKKSKTSNSNNSLVGHQVCAKYITCDTRRSWLSSPRRNVIGEGG